MGRRKVTLRKINGEWKRCYDAGCPDFDAAERNRARVEKDKPDGWWRQPAWLESLDMPLEIKELDE